MSLQELFAEYSIEYFAAIPFSKCRIIAENVLLRRGIEKENIKTAIVFLVPYYVPDNEKGNICIYSRARDYHIFFDGLYKDIVPRLEAEYGAHFYGFADKSAISEVHAASSAGLGLIGDNGLIINEKYGSFVFIGEILTTLPLASLGFEEKAEYEPRPCHHCGACRDACPMKEGYGCLSAVTQKKGELSDGEREFIIRYGSAWGCDICSLVCPYTKKAVESGAITPIEFFKSDRISSL
ncbi:MAG: epoxyqueuosine reductase, partial [Eubacteriales bacterium]